MGRRPQGERQKRARLDVDLAARRALQDDVAERHQGVDPGVELALLALGCHRRDQQARARRDILEGMGHGERDAVADEARQLVLADLGKLFGLLRLERQVGAGEQRHHAALTVHVGGAQQGHASRLIGGRADPQELLVGDVQQHLAADRPVQEHGDTLAPRLVGRRHDPVGQAAGRRRDPGHLGVGRNFQVQLRGLAPRDLVDHGGQAVHHPFFRQHRVIEAGIGAQDRAQIFGNRLGPGEAHPIAQRQEAGRQGRIVPFRRHHLGERADLDLLAAGQPQVEARDRHPGNGKLGVGRPVAAAHRHLEGDLDRMGAAPLDQGGEALLGLQHRGRRAIDPQVAQGHAAGHDRQGDQAAAEHLDLKRAAPEHGRRAQLALVVGPADGIGPLDPGAPGHDNLRGRRNRGGDVRSAVFGRGGEIGRGHDRELGAFVRKAQAEMSRRGARHRQGQRLARGGAFRVQAVADLEPVGAGSVGRPRQALGPLDQLHRLPVDAGLAQGSAGRQDRH